MILRLANVPSKGIRSICTIGQPTSISHPHLLKRPNEILAGFNKSCFAQRRERLFSLLPDNSFAFISGYKLRYSSKNIL
jgi:hypothetical protein